MMFPYLLVFIFSILVDIIPFIGPPAWTVMVFFQITRHLNIWAVLVVGVLGSTIGRYFLTLYIPYLSSKFINTKKDRDLQFLGEKLGGNRWQVQAFVFIYTLVPIPTTPLFTALGMAKIKPSHIILAFFTGKFISDTMMVFAGKFAAENATDLIHGFFSWKVMTGAVTGLLLICVLLFVDWKTLIVKKKLKMNFRIWKTSGKKPLSDKARVKNAKVKM